MWGYKIDLFDLIKQSINCGKHKEQNCFSSKCFPYSFCKHLSHQSRYYKCREFSHSRRIHFVSISTYMYVCAMHSSHNCRHTKPIQTIYVNKSAATARIVHFGPVRTGCCHCSIYSFLSDDANTSLQKHHNFMHINDGDKMKPNEWTNGKQHWQPKKAKKKKKKLLWQNKKPQTHATICCLTKKSQQMASTEKCLRMTFSPAHWLLLLFKWCKWIKKNYEKIFIYIIREFTVPSTAFYRCCDTR